MSFANIGKGVKRDIRVDKIIEANSHTAGRLHDLEESITCLHEKSCDWAKTEELKAVATSAAAANELVRQQLAAQEARIKSTESLAKTLQTSITAVAHHSAAVKAAIPEVPDVAPLQSGFKHLGNSIEDATRRLERLENSTMKRWLIASLLLHAGWVVWLVSTHV